MAILEVKNVGKRFGGLQALSDVNLSVAENSVHAIIGPNGAGKSTLLNCLVGKLIPDTGSVMFWGANPTRSTRWAFPAFSRPPKSLATSAYRKTC